MITLLRRLAVGFVLTSGVFWLNPASAPGAQDQPGKSNRVEFRTIDGGTLRLEDLRGTVVLLDFWATWCAPCLAEMPRLKDLHARYTREDLVIVGISLDTLDRRTFKSWIRRNSIEWPQVHDGRGYNGELARRFDVQKLPVTMVFDREGRVAHRDLRGQALEAALHKLTKSPTHQIAKSSTRARLGIPR